VALTLAVGAVAGTAGDAARYLAGRQVEGGGFAEPNGGPDPSLTAWAVLALRSSGMPAGELRASQRYLVETEAGLERPTELALALLALAALGERPQRLIERVQALQQPSGAIGPTLNSTVWSLLALRGSGLAAPAGSVRYLLAHQTRSGGWSWGEGVAPDSNDTAAAVQALRAAGVSGPPIRQALAYLRRLQNRDGGFELTPGRGSDAQSTAWAIQAFLAAGERTGARPYAYLAGLRRRDGSVRYSGRYAITPVWVTAQVLPALAGKPFPLR